MKNISNRIRKNVLVLVLIVLSLAVSACGDGGGGSLLDYNPVEIGLEYIDDLNPCGALEFNPACK